MEAACYNWPGVGDSLPLWNNTETTPFEVKPGFLHVCIPNNLDEPSDVRWFAVPLFMPVEEVVKHTCKHLGLHSRLNTEITTHIDNGRGLGFVSIQPVVPGLLKGSEEVIARLHKMRDDVVRADLGLGPDEAVVYNMATYDALTPKAFAAFNKFDMAANKERAISLGISHDDFKDNDNDDYKNGKKQRICYTLIVDGKLIGVYASEKEAMDAGMAVTSDFPFSLYY